MKSAPHGQRAERFFVLMIAYVFHRNFCIILTFFIGTFAFYLPSSQKATALAAATLRESTPWDMGIRTV